MSQFRRILDRFFPRAVKKSAIPIRDKKYTRGDRYVANCYKQSLKQNIDSLIAKDHAYIIPDASVKGILTAISKNLYFDPAEQIAKKCIYIWETYQDRILVSDLMQIAYSIESPWRHAHQRLVFFNDLSNPYTFAKIRFTDLAGMTREEEKHLSYKLKNLSYNDYLHTGWWQAIRLEALQRGDYACCVCGATSDLNIHHDTYSHIGQEIHAMDDLRVLCSYHHNLYHDKYG